MAEKRIDIIIGAKNQVSAGLGLALNEVKAIQNKMLADRQASAAREKAIDLELARHRVQVAREAAAREEAIDLELRQRVHRLREEAARGVSARIGEASQSAVAGASRVLATVAKIRVMVSTTSGLVQLMKGDIDAAAKTFGAIPVLGDIGKELGGVGIEALDFFTSWSRQSRGFITEVDEMIEASKKGRREAAKALRGSEGIEAVIKRFSTAGLGEMERALHDLSAARDKELNALKKMAADFPELQQRATEAALLIWQAYYDGVEAVHDEGRRRREAAAAAEADTLKSLQAQVLAGTLELYGRNLEAELVMIRESFRQRIALAKNEAEKAALIQLQYIEEQKAKRRHAEQEKREEEAKKKVASAPTAETGRGGVGAVQVGGRFLGLAARFAGGQDPASDTAKNTEAMRKTLERILKLNEEAKNFRPVWAGHVVRA